MKRKKSVIGKLIINFRDINPNNLIICEGDKLKLIDFNVSISFSNGQQMLQKTGYLEYRAPELVEGGTIGYNESVDLWSTAACFFYMLSGDHAF